MNPFKRLSDKDSAREVKCTNCPGKLPLGVLVGMQGYSNVDASVSSIDSCPFCDQINTRFQAHVKLGPRVTDPMALENVYLEQENIKLKAKIEELKKTTTSDKNIKHVTKLFRELKQNVVSSLSDTIRQEFGNLKATVTSSAHSVVVTDDSLENETNLNVPMSPSVTSTTPDYLESDITEIAKDEHINAKEKIDTSDEEGTTPIN